MHIYTKFRDFTLCHLGEIEIESWQNGSALPADKPFTSILISLDIYVRRRKFKRNICYFFRNIHNCCSFYLYASSSWCIRRWVSQEMVKRKKCNTQTCNIYWNHNKSSRICKKNILWFALEKNKIEICVFWRSYFWWFLYWTLFFHR
jgi:hypothetical protein